MITNNLERDRAKSPNKSGKNSVEIPKNDTKMELSQKSSFHQSEPNSSKYDISEGEPKKTIIVN